MRKVIREQADSRFAKTLFVISLVLWSVSLFINFTSYTFIGDGLKSSVKTVLVAIIALLLVVKCIAFQNYSNGSIFVSLLVAFVSLIAAFLSKDAFPLAFAMFIISAQGIELRGLIKSSIVICIASICLSALYGLLFEPNALFRADIQGISSLTLGFASKNTLGAYLLVVSLGILYLNWERVKISNLCEICFCLLVTKYAHATSSFLIQIICLVIALWKSLSIASLSMKTVYLIAVICLSGSVLFSLACTFTYDVNRPFWNYANVLLSYRPSLAKAYFDNYGISIFGQYIDHGSLAGYSIEAERYALDNAYANFLINYGLVPFAALIIAMLNAIKTMRSNGMTPEIILFSLMLLYGISECLFLYLLFNPFLLCLTVPNVRNGHRNVERS